MDGTTRYQATHKPSGLWKDGESVVYQRLPVTAGSRELVIKMRDSDRQQGFDFSNQGQFELQQNQHLVIEFDTEKKTFVFR